MSEMDWQRPDFSTWRQIFQTRVEASLRAVLPSESPEFTLARSSCSVHLHEAMRYAIFSGGKRIRPLLCYAAGEAVGASLDVLDTVAAGLEMMHVYSLVHDDLPCMDDDDMRRGHPTVHRQYDQATAVLVGDALQTQAFLVLAQVALPVDVRVELIQELANACSAQGVAGGQAIDLASAGQTLSLTALETMHHLKTGSLLCAAVKMGCVCAQTGLDPAFNQALDDYARALGLAFQIIDDVLDAMSVSSILGKTAGKDARQSKSTYVSLFGLEASQARAKELHATALDVLSPFAKTYSIHRLIQLADFIVKRKH